jgi:sortase (surface protein transpeptidase)
VIVSHVDSKAGPALFWRLHALRRGTRVLVEDRNGGVHRFRVTRRRQVEKSSFRPGLVYGASRRPVLVLITCGGPFTPGEGYRDNVILYARAA